MGIPSERADRLIGRICRRLGVTRERGDVAPLADMSAASPSAAATAHGERRCQVQPAALPALRGRDRDEPGRAQGRNGAMPALRGVAQVGLPGLQAQRVGRRAAMRLRVSARRCASPSIRHFEAAQQAFRNFDLAGALEHLERVQELAPNLAGARNGIAKVRQRQADIARVRLAYQTARAGGRLISARGAVEAWSRLVDPRIARAPGRLVRAGPGLRRAETLAARARKPGADRSADRTGILSPEPGDRRRPARGPGRPGPHSAGPAHRPRWPRCCGDRIRLVVDAAASRWSGSAHLRHRSQAGRRAPASRRRHPDRRGQHQRVRRHARHARRHRRLCRAEQAARGRVGLRDLARARSYSWPTSRMCGSSSATRGRAGLVASARRVRGSRHPQARRTTEKPSRRRPASRCASITPWTATSIRMKFTITGSMPSTRCPTAGCSPRPGLSSRRGRSRRSRRWRLPGYCWTRRASPHRLDRTGARLGQDSAHGPSSAHPAGARLTTAEAEALEGRLDRAGRPRSGLRPRASGRGPLLLQPADRLGRTWTVGHSAALSRVADPTELRATRAGSGLVPVLSGIRRHAPLAMGRGGDARSGRRSPGTPPQGPNDPAAITATVSRADYDHQGCWTLSLPLGRASAKPPAIPATSARLASGAGTDRGQLDTGPWHIRVYSLIDLDGVRSISPGLEPTAATILPGPNPEVTVSYVLKRPWLPGLPWSVTFRTEPPGTAVPPMVLVAHPRAVPLSVDDGQIVAALPVRPRRAQFPIRIPLNLAQHDARVFPDPNVEPDALVPIRLRHPETGATRV